MSLAAPVYAKTDVHTDIWTSLSYYHKLPQRRFNLFVNPQVRFIDNRYKLKQVNLFLALSYDFSESTELLLGIYRSYLQQERGSVSGENRWWQQISSVIFEKTSFDLSSRSRLEERIMNGTNEYANRFRQLFTIEMPFIKDLRMVIGNEFFLQLNKPQWVSQQTYSQNRFNIGIRQVIDGVAYEVGYLNQYDFNTTDSVSNVLYFNVAFTDKQSHSIRDLLLGN